MRVCEIVLMPLSNTVLTYSRRAILVNAAGIFLPKSFLEHTEADYDLYLNINKAIFFLTQTVAQNMVKQGRGGVVVNIGSMWAKQAVQVTPSSAYSMAKLWGDNVTQQNISDGLRKLGVSRKKRLTDIENEMN